MNSNSQGDTPRGREAEVGPPAQRSQAFTLLEMLIVIAIIGLLAASSVPAIRALTQTNTIAAGHRQILDDLALARHLAMSGRRVVYLVLVPPTMADQFRRVSASTLLTAKERDLAMRQLTNLVSSQYTGYALFTRRSAGDQPGRERPQYLTAWKQLPDGMIFGTNVFSDLGNNWMSVASTAGVVNRPLPYAWFPFPFENSPEMRLPYVAFDARGRMYYEGGVLPGQPGESIPLMRASLFFPKDGLGRYVLNSRPDLAITEHNETNRMNVRVDWLTGRAKVFKPWEQTAAWK